MTRRWSFLLAAPRCRAAGGVVVPLLALLGLGVLGCAKSPTVIRLQITTQSATPVHLLRTTLARTSNPANPAVISRISQGAGDASDRPAAYTFPLRLDVEAPPGWSGEVGITVEGMTWDDKYVAAVAGVGVAQLLPAAVTEASVELLDVAAPPGSHDIDGGDSDAAAGELDATAGGEGDAADAGAVDPTDADPSAALKAAGFAPPSF